MAHRPNPSSYRPPSLSLGSCPLFSICCVHAQHQGFIEDAFVDTYTVSMKPAAQRLYPLDPTFPCWSSISLGPPCEQTLGVEGRCQRKALAPMSRLMIMERLP